MMAKNTHLAEPFKCELPLPVAADRGHDVVCRQFAFSYRVLGCRRAESLTSRIAWLWNLRTVADRPDMVASLDLKFQVYFDSVVRLPAAAYPFRQIQRLNNGIR